MSLGGPRVIRLACEATDFEAATLTLQRFGSLIERIDYEGRSIVVRVDLGSVPQGDRDCELERVRLALEKTLSLHRQAKS